MPRKPNDRATEFAQRLEKATRELLALPKPGIPDVPIVSGITPECTTQEYLPNKLNEIQQRLGDSGRIYFHGNTVVLEEGEKDKRITPLMVGGDLESGAAGRLANIFICEDVTRSTPRLFPPTDKIVSTVLLHEPVAKALPRIEHYARRPVLDKDFGYRGPGWHPEQGILVHGDDIPAGEPGWPEPGLNQPAIERLPPYLQKLLGEFCFATDTDVANAVGVLITGVLMNHFIESGHGFVLLDGDQPGVGKTLLARTIGMVLDGTSPQIISYTPKDEELGKQTLATLKDSTQSCLIFDNAKVRSGQKVSSPFLEANSVADNISLRILGVSQNYVRPNDLLWFLTMNSTQVAADIASRGILIQFRFEGDASRHRFQGDPIGYAKRYRKELLGELFSMVLKWEQEGQLEADRPHRLRYWAKTVGGILEANGLPEFLSNSEVLVNEMTSETDQLAALAEKCLANRKYFFNSPEGISDAERDNLIIANGGTASQWIKVFENAEVMTEEFETAKSEGAKTSRISKLFGTYLNRRVQVSREGSDLTLLLRKATGRSRKTCYAFQVISEVKDEEPRECCTEPQEASERASKPVVKAKVTRVSLAGKAKGAKPVLFANNSNPKPSGNVAVRVASGGNTEDWGS